MTFSQSVLFLFLICGVASCTEVKFTPGPGLKKNADGSYSRVLDKEYLESVGAGDASSEDPEVPPSSSVLTNIGVSLLLIGAGALWINHDALASFAKSASTAIPSLEQKTTTGKRMTQAEIDEARAARLARFTGDGPKKAEVAFTQALEQNELQTTSRKGPSATSVSPSGGVATLGALASAEKDDKNDPDEYFGGDSTNTQY